MRVRKLVKEKEVGQYWLEADGKKAEVPIKLDAINHQEILASIEH